MGPHHLTFILLLILPAGSLLVSGAWGDWESVSCYTCGLASISPETDKPGSYGVIPGYGKKMYNHSCDLMDNGIAGNYLFAGQDLAPRDWVDYIPRSAVMTVNGTVVKNCTTPAPSTSTNTSSSSGSSTSTSAPTSSTAAAAATTTALQDCPPAISRWIEVVPKPPKAYEMDMWVRKCPPGVQSCFKAEGNWAKQKPEFRGCAEAQYTHGTTCNRQLQAVSVTPGQPKVNVEVYLCYCSSDLCNIDISGSEMLQISPLSSLASTVLFVLLVFIWTVD